MGELTNPNRIFKVKLEVRNIASVIRNPEIEEEWLLMRELADMRAAYLLEEDTQLEITGECIMTWSDNIYINSL